MKQYQANKAYGALNKIANQQLPVRDSYNIYMLLKSLEPVYRFELEQERRLVQKYGGEVGSNGSVRIPDRDDANRFKEEIEELNNLEIDLDIKPVVINCDALNDLRISPYDVSCLEGFVDFV